MLERREFLQGLLVSPAVLLLKKPEKKMGVEFSINNEVYEFLVPCNLSDNEEIQLDWLRLKCV